MRGNRGKKNRVIPHCDPHQVHWSWVCHCAHIPADGTLPLRLQGSEHDDDRVVPGWGLDKATELVPVHPDDRTPRGPLHHLVNLLWQQILSTQSRRRAERGQCIPLGYLHSNRNFNLYLIYFLLKGWLHHLNTHVLKCVYRSWGVLWHIQKSASSDVTKWLGRKNELHHCRKCIRLYGASSGTTKRLYTTFK